MSAEGVVFVKEKVVSGGRKRTIEKKAAFRSPSCPKLSEPGSLAHPVNDWDWDRLRWEIEIEIERLRLRLRLRLRFNPGEPCILRSFIIFLFSCKRCYLVNTWTRQPQPEITLEISPCKGCWEGQKGTTKVKKSVKKRQKVIKKVKMSWKESRRKKSRTGNVQ